MSHDRPFSIRKFRVFCVYNWEIDFFSALSQYHGCQKGTKLAPIFTDQGSFLRGDYVSLWALPWLYLCEAKVEDSLQYIYSLENRVSTSHLTFHPIYWKVQSALITRVVHHLNAFIFVCSEWPLWSFQELSLQYWPNALLWVLHFYCEALWLPRVSGKWLNTCISYTTFISTLKVIHIV